MSVMDKAIHVRQGEELDASKVESYLRDTISGLQGDIEIRQFPSGFSNLTYLIKFDNRDLVLRRPPFGKKAKSAHDMLREYRILKSLKPHFRYCPEALSYCEDPAVMDVPFYVMERLKGIILRKDLPEGMALNPGEARTLSENLVKVLFELHTIDYKAAGLGDFGKPEGYVQRQVEGWSKRYRDARTEDAPDCEKVMEWLHVKMPPDTDTPSIIHNDYKLDNAVLNPDNPLEITGILDWEMATLGDPLMDLGNSLAYWVEKNDPQTVQLIRMMPTNLEGMLTRNEQVALYSELTGRKIDNFDYRFFHGQTTDKRFGMLIHAVKVLEGFAVSITEKSDL
jgi:aminoglycoside phosphotransferase (APT) family kinase protein